MHVDQPGFDDHRRDRDDRRPPRQPTFHDAGDDGGGVVGLLTGPFDTVDGLRTAAEAAGRAAPEPPGGDPEHGDRGESADHSGHQ
ncbi:hypothetical protein [Pseudonocardia sp. Ae707_Ps2]|uniref:hypothetical protein n=1 Tax=Pseudonocardia sp. Ae707_Ps2 TaxID=2212992 RepID=UPI00307DB48E